MLPQSFCPQRIAGFAVSAPSRGWIAVQQAAEETWAVVLPEVLPPSSPGRLFRRPSRSHLGRFVAHLLIRLLIVTPLPPQLQAAAVLFPVSILWGLVGSAEAETSGEDCPAGEGQGAPEDVGCPVSEGAGGISVEPCHPTGLKITVLVINAGNGIVASFTADNDGAIGLLVPAELPASISDRLLVTIEDPSGNVTTFEKSEFVDPATGRTAVGPGGGTVQAADGSGAELRIPQGATDKGVVLKIESFQLEDLPEDQRQTPDFPTATFGGGLKISSEDRPSFQKEVKLAFPKPADAPEGAFFYVVRRLEGPNGTVSFETIDHGFVEGGKVVTASYPFIGYTASYGSLDPTGALATLSTVHALLMWTFDSALPGKARSGVVEGKVLRTKWDPGAAVPSYEAIKDAVVSALHPDGSPAWLKGSHVAVSQKDGTFTLYDPQYTGGSLVISATVNGEPARTATAFQANPLDSSSPPNLRFYPHYAKANVTFPAVEPPPKPPLILIRAFRTQDGTRVDTNGLAVANQPLVIGFTTKNVEVRGATINGQQFAARVDPLKGRPGGMDQILDPDFTPGQAGTYTVTATALPTSGPLVPITSSLTFRVVAEGGSNNDPLPDDPPAVITARTVPKAGATGVEVTVFPQVVFTEPVKNVPGNVTLTELGGSPVPLKISGVGPQGPIADLTNNPEAVVTSLTLQPMLGLKYGVKYTLALTAGIVDLDPEPKPLKPESMTFTTFGPKALIDPGTGATFGSAGIFVLGLRAYLVENFFAAGALRVFDVTDPVAPAEIESARSLGMIGRPVDVAGEEGTVVVAMGPHARSLPSSLYVYDVSDPNQARWVGAASVTASINEGFVNRVAVKDDRAYTATGKKGIQVVDLAEARRVFAPCCGADHARMLQALGTDGRGYGQSAVVATIPVQRPGGKESMLYDLEAGSFVLAGQSQTLVVATGFATPLVIANPQTVSVVWQGSLKAPDNSAELTTGIAVGLGHVNDRDVAVVAGGGLIGGVSKGMLATVSLADPENPTVLGFLDLGQEPCLAQTGINLDVLVKDATAYVGGTDPGAPGKGCVVLVSLDGPRPALAGVLKDIGGRLAMGQDGILFGTAMSRFGGADPLGGVRTAALGSLTVITKVMENPVLLALDRTSIEPQRLRYRSIPVPDTVSDSEVEILFDQDVVQRISARLDGTGEGEITLPGGTSYPQGRSVRARLIVNRDDPNRPRPALKTLLAETFDAEPAEALTLEVGEQVEVAALNGALLERLANDPETATPALRWEGPGVLSTLLLDVSEPTGVYGTELTAHGAAGSTGRMRLLKGSKVVAQSGTMTLTAGPPVFLAGRLVATPPATAPSLQGGVVVIPADGMSQVILTLEDVLDLAGNKVPDGTPVEWSLEGEDGELLNAEESVLLGGRASVVYQAGEEPGDVTVLALPGTAERAREHVLIIRQAPLQFEEPAQTAGPMDTIDVTVRIRSAGGPPADGTASFWWTTRGRILGDTQVQGGVTTATWSEVGIPLRPRVPVPRRILSFVTVGRARSDIRIDRAPLIIGGPQIRAIRDRILVDVPPGFIGPFQSQATLEVSDGPPNGTVRLVLGSTRFPAVEPVAAFAFDDDSGGLAEDGYGGTAGSIANGVIVDQSDPTHQPASFRFDGSGGVTIADGPVVALTGDFGFSVWVRFDSLAAGQKVVERAGSYSLELVLVDGQARLALRVVAGGQVREVVSKQPLDLGAWYHVAAHIKSTELALVVAGEDRVDLGTGVPTVGGSAAPVVVGGTLVGGLDELAIYDFTRSPLMVFSNGLTEVDVVLDGDGRGDAQVVGASSFFSAAGQGEAPGDERPSPPGIFGQRVRTVPFRIFMAPEPLEPNVRPERFNFNNFLEGLFGNTVRGCVDGLGSGESEDVAGTICDMGASFVPVVGNLQDFRDLYSAVKNFTKGKQNVGDYVKGAFATVGLAILAITNAKRIGRAFQKAKEAIFGVSAEARLARAALRKVSRAVEEGALESEGLVVRTLAEDFGDAETKRAVLHLVGVCDGAPCGSITAKAQDLIDDIAARYADDAAKDAFLKGLGKAYLRTGHEGVEKLLRGLKRAPGMRLSADAIEGLSVFVRHTKGKNRVWSVWDELSNFHGLSQAQANDAAERMFRMLRDGDNKIRVAALSGPNSERLLAAWHNFIARGAGTSRHRSSTRGFFHHLELIQREAPEKIRMIDSEFPGYHGRPDLLVDGPDGIIQKEFKAIGATGSLKDGDHLAQLERNIKAAMDRARSATSGGVLFEDALRGELQRIVYVFRGPIRDDLKQQILTKARAVLRGKYKPLADEIYKKIDFQGALPF